MKRFFIGVLSALLVAACFLFASCSQNRGIYEIDVNLSNYYEVKGRTHSCMAGDEAYIYLEPYYNACRIDKVFYNGNECAQDGDKYIFVMPAEDVEITVSLIWEDNVQDEYLSWQRGGDNQGGVGEDSWALDFGFTIAVSFRNIWVSVMSLNEDVIPNEAFDVYLWKADGSDYYERGRIIIDCEQIHEGTAQIVVTVKDRSNPLYTRAALVTTVTVAAAATE